jgi:hypothetical protein
MVLKAEELADSDNEATADKYSEIAEALAAALAALEEAMEAASQ